MLCVFFDGRLQTRCRNPSQHAQTASACWFFRWSAEFHRCTMSWGWMMVDVYLETGSLPLQLAWPVNRCSSLQQQRVGLMTVMRYMKLVLWTQSVSLHHPQPASHESRSSFLDVNQPFLLFPFARNAVWGDAVDMLRSKMMPLNVYFWALLLCSAAFVELIFP